MRFAMTVARAIGFLCVLVSCLFLGAMAALVAQGRAIILKPGEIIITMNLSRHSGLAEKLSFSQLKDD